MAATIDSESKTLQARLLSGSVVLLTGSGLATGINFAYNISVARFLGPTAFGNASAVYTLLILISAVTLSFQIVSAKVVAQQTGEEARNNAYRHFHRRAWIAGITVALLFLLLRNVIAEYLRLPDSLLVVLLSLGIAFYVPLGSRRGYLQGACGFKALAGNLVLEGFARLAGSLLCIYLGYGVEGVIAANAAAVAVAYLFAGAALPSMSGQPMPIPDAFREAMQAIVFFVGQVIINNCDIVVVKHFFPPTPAGLYAAVALVGRVIFAFSWAVVNTMFPIVAGTKREQNNYQVLGISLMLVFSMGSLLTIGLRFAPAWIWTSLFGSQFATAGRYGFPYLLALYAATTCVYSLCVVLIAYEMSYKIANTSWVQLLFSCVLIAGIYRYHSSLQQVIAVQFVMMSILLVIVALPFLWAWWRRRSNPETEPLTDEMRLLRRVSEDQVIYEFLRSDFQNPEFEDYREPLGDLVKTPNLSDPSENAKRRALLFLRHGSLWRELPDDTEWFEAQIQKDDLERIRVFPRAQWRKLARGNYALTEILKVIAAGRKAENAFLQKISELRAFVSSKETDPGAVLLIGINATGPFTILDGNHRLVAASLAMPLRLDRVRVYCGLSPKMINCCWYKTNFSTLARYGANLVRHSVNDADDEIERLMQGSSR